MSETSWFDACSNAITYWSPSWTPILTRFRPVSVLLVATNLTPFGTLVLSTSPLFHQVKPCYHSEVRNGAIRPKHGLCGHLAARPPVATMRRPHQEIRLSLGQTFRAYRMSAKTIRALDRGLDVLRIIQESKAVSLNDLHLATRLPKATLLRILKTLIGRDLVWQRIADGAYVPSYIFSKRARVFDEETHLAEVAAPILADLCKRVRWPSTLLCPRLDHMVTIDTNRPMSDFDYIMSPNPVGSFNVNMLRSASGRCYLAFCSPKERAAILARLRKSVRPGDALAHNTAKLEQAARRRTCAWIRHPRSGFWRTL